MRKGTKFKAIKGWEGPIHASRVARIYSNHSNVFSAVTLGSIARKRIRSYRGNPVLESPRPDSKAVGTGVKRVLYFDKNGTTVAVVFACNGSVVAYYDGKKVIAEQILLLLQYALRDHVEPRQPRALFQKILPDLPALVKSISGD